MTPAKKLDLSIEVDVLTAGTTAEIVNAILETLLFQRNQIPFVYKTYRYYVNKWQEQNDNKSTEGGADFLPQNFQVHRTKQQAMKTKEAISSMRQVIRNIFERKPIKCLRFLFGPTIFTAKEAYTLHIPTENIAVNHFEEHHKIPQNKLNQSLLSLLTSEQLYALFSNNMNPTNMYLELEVLENEHFGYKQSKRFSNSTEIFPKEFSSLPASCKDIHIHLLHKKSEDTNYESLTCCKELKVFEDLIHLNLDCNSEESADNKNEKSKEIQKNVSSMWWEAEIVVRGFKDKPIKGFNIWT